MPASKQKIIIEAAKKLFADKGYESTSVRDIADLAENNVSSISYYFGGKEELFKAVVKDCLKDTVLMLNILNDRPKDLGELKMLLKNFLKLFCAMRSENPSGFCTVSRNMEAIVDIAPEIFESSIWRLKENLKNLLKQAQKDKILRKSLEPDFLAIIIMSAIAHLLKEEKITTRFAGQSVLEDTYKNKYINHIVSCYLDGAKETK